MVLVKAMLVGLARMGARVSEGMVVLKRKVGMRTMVLEMTVVVVVVVVVVEIMELVRKAMALVMRAIVLTMRTMMVLVMKVVKVVAAGLRVARFVVVNENWGGLFHLVEGSDLIWRL